MKDECGPNFPEWLLKARRESARKWAFQTTEERIAGTHKAAQEALQQGAEWRAAHPEEYARLKRELLGAAPPVPTSARAGPDPRRDRVPSGA